MNLSNLPPKAELMGWSPKTLADYMKKLKLTGCDKVVMKSNISGSKFMHMNASELQAFPSLYIPIVTKIQHEIHKVEQKKPLIPRYKTQPKPNQVEQEEEHWKQDECGSDQETDSDNDYESPIKEEGEGSYICSLTDEEGVSDEDNDEIYVESDEMQMPPPGLLAEENKLPRHPRVPAQSQREKPRAVQPIISPDRSMKHGSPCPAPRDLKQSGSIVKPASKSIGIFPSLRARKHNHPPNKEFQPAPPMLTEHAKVNNPQQGQKQGLYPSWYGGKVTRRQAEDALREINKDGAFVVRDSSAGSADHPYTLMILKADKVYNIRIRKEDNYFILGSGFGNSKSFPGLKEMISHHRHKPMQLIDGKDKSNEAVNHCLLLHPVIL